MSLPIEDLPDVVNVRLAAFVEDLRFWVERERVRPTPAAARSSLDEIQQKADELLAAIDKLDHTPRAHIVANLPAGGLPGIRSAVALLQHAADVGGAAVPRHKGNVEVGVPRFAADKIVEIFSDNQLPITVSGSAIEMTPAMRALSSVLEAAQHRPTLGQSALCKYLRLAVNPSK